MNKIWLIICIQFYIGILKAEDGTNTVKKPNNTNNMVLIVEIPLLEPPSTNTFNEQLQFNLRDRFDDTSRRKLHPFNTLNRLLTAKTPDQYDQHAAKIGKELFRNSTQYGLRETLKDAPFIHSFINQDTFIAKLFRDSIGNTAEETLSSRQTLYATNELTVFETITGYDETEHTNSSSRWKKIVDHTHLRYGMRWNYAYTAWTLGRSGDKPILFMNLRYHYGDIVAGKILDTETEFLTSMPFGEKTLCTFGISQDINPPDWDRHYSFKVSHRIDGGRIFIGVAIHDKTNRELIRPIIGFEKPW